MSSIGLNSNLYEVSRYYLDLLNSFVVESNYALSQKQSISNSDVISFFKSLDNQALSEPQLIIVYSLFNYYYKQRNRNIHNELNDIVSKLEQSRIDGSLLSSIAELIEVLNTQCVQSYLKIKGIK